MDKENIQKIIEEETPLIIRDDIILRAEYGYINTNTFIVKDSKNDKMFYITEEGFKILTDLSSSRTIKGILGIISPLDEGKLETVYKFLDTFLKENIIVKTEKYEENKNVLKNLDLKPIDKCVYTPMSFPSTINLYLTNRCNLMCRHCINSSSPNELKGDELSTETIKDLLNQFDNGGLLVLKFSGGEPLCREDINEILLSAAQYRFTLELFSNGLLIREEDIELFSEITKIKQKGFSINVSIDGATPNSHDWLRGKEGAFFKTLETLKLLAKNKIKTSVEAIIHQKNKEELEEIINICLDNGVSGVYFHPAAFNGRAMKEKDLYLNIDDMSRILLRGNDLIEKYAKYTTIIFDPYRIPFKKEENKKERLALPPNSCPAGMCDMVISCEGKVYPCIEAVGFHKLEMGDVKKRNIGDIWEDDKWSILRGGWELKELKVCNTCKFKQEECNVSRCRCYPYKIFGDFYGPLPECFYNYKTLELSEDKITPYLKLQGGLL
ncbi:MAG: radical SAM protein [bacterium]